MIQSYESVRIQTLHEKRKNLIMCFYCFLIEIIFITAFMYATFVYSILLKVFFELKVNSTDLYCSVLRYCV